MDFLKYRNILLKYTLTLINYWQQCIYYSESNKRLLLYYLSGKIGWPCLKTHSACIRYYDIYN